MPFIFGDMVLDARRRELCSGSILIPIEPQVFDILEFLIRNRDRVVSKDDLLAGVWDGRTVSDSAIAARINAARRVIGDDGEQQRWIRTISRKGFRFVGDVREEERSKAPNSAATATAEKDPLGTTPAGTPGPVAMPKPNICYCMTPDRVRIAYALMGAGPPLVRMATWLSHIEHSLVSPFARHIREELIKENTVLFYDPRGNGLSDWDVEDFSLDAFVRDLQAAVDAARVDRFALFGISHGGVLAVAYAAKHPDRVSGLILCNTWARGWRKRGGNPDEIERRTALGTLILRGWGQDNPAYRQMFSSLFLPDGTAEQIYWLTELERVSTSPKNAHRMYEANSKADVSGILHTIKAPTLILHTRHDVIAPFSEGQALAAGIPGARFVPLESRNHILSPEEPAWRVFQMELRSFLRQISRRIGSPAAG